MSQTKEKKTPILPLGDVIRHIHASVAMQEQTLEGISSPKEAAIHAHLLLIWQSAEAHLLNYAAMLAQKRDLENSKK